MFSHHSRALRRAIATPRQVAFPVRCNSSASPKLKSLIRQPPKVIFSGIQPTGIPHLGNYLGALRQWVKLQDEAEPNTTLLFSIVDLHAITTQQDASELARWRKEMLASLYAIGLKKEKSIVFYQSAVPQHAELMWLLSCNASMGYLSRMTQWKVRISSSHYSHSSFVQALFKLCSSSVQHVDEISQSKLSLPSDASPLDPSPTNKTALKLGLFSYPVLQAADILLYNTTHVPVGEDQAQHLEFARELAAGFNHVYAPKSKEPILIPPQTILSPAKRVMSLTNPTKKMSKSDPDPKSRVLITDSFEEISRKFRTALTDSIEGVSYDHATRPGVSNLVDIIYYMDESKFPSPEAAAQDMNALSMKALKEQAAKTVETGLRDVRGRYKFIMERKNADHILEAYARKAKNQAGGIAWSNMNRIKELMGLGQNM